MSLSQLVGVLPSVGELNLVFGSDSLDLAECRSSYDFLKVALHAYTLSNLVHNAPPPPKLHSRQLPASRGFGEPVVQLMPECTVKSGNGSIVVAGCVNVGDTYCSQHRSDQRHRKVLVQQEVMAFAQDVAHLSVPPAGDHVRGSLQFYYRMCERESKTDVTITGAKRITLPPDLFIAISSIFASHNINLNSASCIKPASFSSRGSQGVFRSNIMEGRSNTAVELFVKDLRTFVKETLHGDLQLDQVCCSETGRRLIQYSNRSPSPFRCTLFLLTMHIVWACTPMTQRPVD